MSQLHTLDGIYIKKHLGFPIEGDFCRSLLYLVKIIEDYISI
jgi:hypothetical protein